MSKIVTLNYYKWGSEIKESLNGVDEIVFKGVWISAYAGLFKQIKYGIVTPIRLRFCFSGEITWGRYHFYSDILDAYKSATSSVLLYDFSACVRIEVLVHLFKSMNRYLSSDVLSTPIRELVYVVTGNVPMVVSYDTLENTQTLRRIKQNMFAIRSAQTTAGTLSVIKKLPIEMCRMLASFML